MGGQNSYVLIKGKAGTEGTTGGNAGSGGCPGLGGYFGKVVVKGLNQENCEGFNKELCLVNSQMGKDGEPGKNGKVSF